MPKKNKNIEKIRKMLDKKLETCQADVELIQGLYNKAVFASKKYNVDLTKAIHRLHVVRDAIELIDNPLTSFDFNTHKY